MTSDALSPSDGTQPPEASVEPLNAGPPPEPLSGFDVPRLPDLPALRDLPSLPDLTAALTGVAANTADLDGANPADHPTDHSSPAQTVADVEQPGDEVPTPPQWPAVSPEDVPPAFAVPWAPPAAPAALPMPAQPPTRPARPPVRDPEPSLLGLTRRSHTRVGQLAFKWIFVIIFAVILIQMIIALLTTR